MWIPSLVPIWHFLMPRANSSLQNFIAPLVRLNPHIGSWPASTRFKQLPMHVHVPYIKNVFKICVQLFETSYQKLQFQQKLGVFHINDPEYDQDHPENLKLVPWGTDGRLPLSDLDLDHGSGHTAYRRDHSSTSTYVPSFIEIGRKFFLKVTTDVLVKFRVAWHKN